MAKADGHSGGNSYSAPALSLVEMSGAHTTRAGTGGAPRHRRVASLQEIHTVDHDNDAAADDAQPLLLRRDQQQHLPQRSSQPGHQSQRSPSDDEEDDGEEDAVTRLHSHPLGHHRPAGRLYCPAWMASRQAGTWWQRWPSSWHVPEAARRAAFAAGLCTVALMAALLLAAGATALAQARARRGAPWPSYVRDGAPTASGACPSASAAVPRTYCGACGAPGVGGSFLRSSTHRKEQAKWAASTRRECSGDPLMAHGHTHRAERRAHHLARWPSLCDGTMTHVLLAHCPQAPWTSARRRARRRGAAGCRRARAPAATCRRASTAARHPTALGSTRWSASAPQVRLTVFSRRVWGRGQGGGRACPVVRLVVVGRGGWQL